MVNVNKQLKKAPQGYFCISTKQPEQITIIQYGNNTADIQSSKNLTIYILNDFNDIQENEKIDSL